MIFTIPRAATRLIAALAGALAAAAVAIAITPAAAFAQSCAPKTWLTPTATGSPVIEFASADGLAPRWWCPAAAPPGGDPGLRYWTLSGVHCLSADCWRILPAAKDRVVAAASAWGQFTSEVAANARTPASGTAEACAFARLQRDACIAARQVNAGAPFPAPLSAADAAARCGPTPAACVAPPSVQYLTPSGGSAIYAVTGGKVGLPTGRRAPGSALCDCAALKLTSGGFTYCPLAGGPTTEVVLAIPQP